MSLYNGQVLSSVISLLLIQLIFIKCLSYLLYIFFKPLKQPLVIAEIVAGIILGPSILGFIPGYMDTIFPTASIEKLNEIAQLALVFYLFLIGLSLTEDLRQNVKLCLIASGFGTVIPYSVGIPLAFALNNSNYSETNLATLILFVGFSLFIPSLCVLPRILAEKRLLDTQLGIISIKSAAIDTLNGMLLFAILLSVSGTGSKFVPLWTILLCIAQFFALWFIIKPILTKIGTYVSKKGRLDIRTFFFICLIVICVSWFTEVIGISASFGAFEVGLIVPRKGPLIRILQGKLEDFVIGICLPIFFALSGLKTNFRLLNDSTSLALTAAIVVAGFISKSIAVFIAGMIAKLPWRQSLSFGFLMSVKGLIALVMFNIALGDNIITQRFFTMLVTSVLISCFIITPLLYLLVKELKEKPLKPKSTFNILLVPQNSDLSPSMVSIANSFSSKDTLQTKIFVLRLLEPEEGLYEYNLVTKKKKNINSR
jgi:Kef-type K+ transport system membrane component KefB